MTTHSPGNLLGIAKDIAENELNDLLNRIYRLFYDQRMVDGLFSDIQQRQAEKEKLDTMDLEDLVSLAFGEELTTEECFELNKYRNVEKTRILEDC